MRKADNTIVFGSQTAPPSTQRTPITQVTPSQEFFEAAPPTLPTGPTSLRTRPLSEDLIDDRSYMTRPERGLVFAAVSLALIGIAAGGTFMYLRREPEVSTTMTTSAEVQPATAAQRTQTATKTEPPAPAATPADQPWQREFDAVRAPGVQAPQTAPQVAKEIATPQMLPTERAANAAPAPTVYASKIEGAQPAPGQTAQRITTTTKTTLRTPPPGMSDEALERAGFYGNLNAKPVPTLPSNTDVPEPRVPSAGSTTEPKSFTPNSAPDQGQDPSKVLPDVTIKQ